MRRRWLVPCLSTLVLAQDPAPPVLPIRVPFAPLAAWAGPDAASKGFTEARLAEFLGARRTDLTAAARAPWSDWLRGLESSTNPSLSAWALARRVEAGDLAAYPAYEAALAEHLLGITTPGSGRQDKVITRVPFSPGWGMPGPLVLSPASSFWHSLRKTILERADRKVEPGLYNVWCWGTHPNQRDLILEVAAQVQALPTVSNRNPDPWNDPRFWIVTDWLLAWGSPADLEAIRGRLPSVHARKALDRMVTALEEAPGYFKSQPRTPAEWEQDLRNAAPPQRDGQASRTWTVAPPQPLGHARALRYPREAAGRGMMTHLTLEIAVDPEGKAQSCRPVPGPWLGFFAPEGCAYGLSWTFRPGRVNGVATLAPYHFTVPFTLKR